MREEWDRKRAHSEKERFHHYGSASESVEKYKHDLHSSTATAGKGAAGLGCSRCSPPGSASGGMRFPRTRSALFSAGQHYLAATGRRQCNRGIKKKTGCPVH